MHKNTYCIFYYVPGRDIIREIQMKHSYEREDGFEEKERREVHVYGYI